MQDLVWLSTSRSGGRRKDYTAEFVNFSGRVSRGCDSMLVILIFLLSFVIPGCGPSDENVPLPPPPETVHSSAAAGAALIRLAPVVDGRPDTDIATSDGKVHYHTGSELPEYIAAQLHAKLAGKGFVVVESGGPTEQPGLAAPQAADTLAVTLKWASATGHPNQVVSSMEISVQLRDPQMATVYNEDFRGTGTDQTPRYSEADTLRSISSALAAAASQAVDLATSDLTLATALRSSSSTFASNRGHLQPTPAAGASPEAP